VRIKVSDVVAVSGLGRVHFQCTFLFLSLPLGSQ